MSKKNYLEKNSRMQKPDRHEHLGLRKLTVGVASALVGFSFLLAGKLDIVKADTVVPTDLTKQTSDNEQTLPEKPVKSQKVKPQKKSSNLTSFAGLSSFLRKNATADKKSSNNKQTAIPNKSAGIEQSDSEPVKNQDNGNQANDNQNLTGQVNQVQVTADSSDAGQATIKPQKDNILKDGDCLLVYNVADNSLHIKAGKNGNQLGAGGPLTVHQSFSGVNYNFSDNSIEAIVNGADNGYWGQENFPIEKLVFDDNIVLAADSSYKFYYLRQLKEIDGLDKVDTSQVTDMSYMFYDDNEISTLDLRNFDTRQVTDMAGMFFGMNNIETLDVSNFDTSQVADMRFMFGSDLRLVTLDLHNFNTSQVTNMRFMFGSDLRLANLDVSNFDTRQVTDMYLMFVNDIKLRSLDISGFDTENVTSMDNMLSDIGDPDHFVLSLGKNTKLYGRSNVASGKKYIRAVGKGTKDNPQGDVLTASELEALYDQNIGTLPKETYVMENSSDAMTYGVIASPLKIHNAQTYAGNPDSLLTFANAETTMQLKKQQDKFAPANKVVAKIAWLPNKVMTTKGLEDGGMIADEHGKLNYKAIDVADQQGQATIEVTYGDGSIADVPVTIEIIAPKAKANESVDSEVAISNSAQYYIANTADLASFNPVYEFVDQNGNYLADGPIFQWPKDDSIDSTYPENMYVKVSYYQDAAHQHADGSEIVNVQVKVKVPKRNVVVHHYLSGTDTTVPGMADTVVSGDVNSTVTVSASDPDQQAPIGYFLETTSDQNSGIITVDRQSSVTFYYKTVPIQINIAYVLDDDNDVQIYQTDYASSPNKLGDTVTATAKPAPTGYNLVSEKTQTKKLTPDILDVTMEDIGDPVYSYTITFKYSVVDPVGKTLTVYQQDVLGDEQLQAAIANYHNLAGNITEVTWQNGLPDTSELGTTSAVVDVTSSDSNFGTREVLVPIKVIAKPRLTMADMYHPVGDKVTVPQYTDLPQDTVYAQEGIANNADMPKGTTYVWEKHAGQVPDTSVANSKSSGFVRISFPDGSYKSVKVNVLVEDKITKDIKLKHSAYLYNDQGKRANGITLKAGSIITTYGTKVINGRQFYLLDDENYYLAVGNDKPVLRSLDKNAYTYDAKGKRVGRHVTNRGVQIKTYGLPVLIDGKEYYYIGDGQYMKKNNFSPTPEWQEPEISAAAIAAGHSMQHLAKNSYLYDENGKRTGQLTLKSGSNVEVTGVKTINGEDYYALADGGYLKQGNFAD